MHLVTLDVKGMTVMPRGREAMGREARGQPTSDPPVVVSILAILVSFH